jgi:hypothetical protein
MPDGDRGLVNRITTVLRRVTGRGGAAPTGAGEQAGDTTVTGTMTVNMINAWAKSIFELSSSRMDVYDEAEEMDDTVEEINVGLDKLASTTMAGREGSQETFTVHFAEDSDPRAEEIVDQLIRTTKLRDKSYTIIREGLLHGDKFIQPVVDKSLRIVRIMQMPVRSMHRNEDDTGLLLEGETEGEWAFEQRQEKTNRWLAGFYPWQIIHLRWNRRGEDKYGRSLLYPSRVSFKKLRAMEEALTINWLTRAFARLIFLLDHTNLSKKQRELRIKQFQESLLTTTMADGSTGKDPLTVVKDIFLSVGYHTDVSDDGKPVPELTDVKVADTSSAGYRDLSPIKYYLRKMLRPLRIPPAFLGIEDEVNAKATLNDQKDEYAAFIRWIQSWFSLYLVELFDLALLLQGIDPLKAKYEIVWPAPFKDDEFQGARTDMVRAQADKLRLEQGVIDQTWIATRRMGMSDEEWQEIQARIAEQAQNVATENGNGQDTAPQTEEFVQGGGVKGLLARAVRSLTEEGRPVTPGNITRFLLEQGGGKAEPTQSYRVATDAYRQGLQAIYDKWAAETSEALSDIDPDDSEEFNRKLEDALIVLLMLLHQHGASNLDKAFHLGYGGQEVGPDGLRQIQSEIENNYYYLETSLIDDIRQRIDRDIEEFQDELRSDRRDEAIALLLAMLATRKAQLDRYAGQYWHSLWSGWALREQQAEEKRIITWYLDPLARHCRDCPEYAGEYEDINALLAATGGVLPGQGTECDGNCRCWLD